MRALVTGANGFAGRHLVSLLRSRGDTVLAAGHGAPWPCDFRLGDQVAEAVEEARADVIFHLAGTSSVAEAARDPRGANENIVGPAVHVMQAAGRARVLLVSTCHVYGEGRTGEEDPLGPVDVYGAARASVEYMAATFRAKGRDIVIARAFHHTGPGQDRRFAFGDWAARYAAGERVISVGNLEVRRDYADVRDIVAGYVVLAERAQSLGAYNLCSGAARSLRELFSMVAPDAVAVVDSTRIRGREVAEIVGSAARAEALGWRRFHRIEETLAALREWASA